MRYIIIAVCLISVLPLFAQNVLFYDILYFGDYEALFDTLTSHGVTIHYVSDEGWTNLMDMDMLWFQSPGDYDDSLSDAPPSFISKISSIVNFAYMGGKIVIATTEIGLPGHYCINRLLTDPGWQTTMYIRTPSSEPATYCENFIPFPPFTNNVDTLILECPTRIEYGTHAYPFAFLDSNHTQAVAAISYPFLNEGNCASFVVLATGTYGWQTGFETIADNYRFASNILLTAAGVPGYELAPGAIPGGGNACDSMAEWGYNICNRYPNPFTPGEASNKEVVFEYYELGEKPATLYIYNVQNILVREISIPASYSASKNKVHWDGRDNYGNPMRQGLYLYVIESEGQIICSGSVILAR